MLQCDFFSYSRLPLMSLTGSLCTFSYSPHGRFSLTHDLSLHFQQTFCCYILFHMASGSGNFPNTSPPSALFSSSSCPLILMKAAPLTFPQAEGLPDSTHSLTYVSQPQDLQNSAPNTSHPLSLLPSPLLHHQLRPPPQLASLVLFFNLFSAVLPSER